MNIQSSENESELCRGCAILCDEKHPEDISDQNCCYSKFNMEGDCPCTNCLVKVTCRNGCAGYDLWIDDPFES